MFAQVRRSQAQTGLPGDETDAAMEAADKDGTAQFSSDDSEDAPEEKSSDDTPENPQNTLKYGAFPVVLPTKTGMSPIFIQETSPEELYEIHWMCGVREDPCVADIIQILASATPDVTVVFYLSGPGGNANVAARVVSAMQTTSATVKTYALGQCASSSALMWAYGHERYVEPGTCLIFHMSLHGDHGNTDVVHDSALIIQKYVRSLLLNAKIRGTVLYEDEIKGILEDHRDIYLDADTCAARGISLHEPKGVRYE